MILAHCSSMLETLGGNKPLKPSLSRSAGSKAVPLLYNGSWMTSMPRWDSGILAGLRRRYGPTVPLSTMAQLSLSTAFSFWYAMLASLAETARIIVAWRARPRRLAGRAWWSEWLSLLETRSRRRCAVAARGPDKTLETRVLSYGPRQSIERTMAEPSFGR